MVVVDRFLFSCLSRQPVYYCIRNNSHVIPASYQQIGEKAYRVITGDGPPVGDMK